MTLITSPNAIYRWLGIGPVRRSDNLKLPDPEKARLARIFWEIDRTQPDERGGDDAA